MPTRNSVTVSWAVPASAPKASAIAGSEGRDMSMESAPTPTTAVSRMPTRTLAPGAADGIRPPL
jgi:hypothetical protein